MSIPVQHRLLFSALSLILLPISSIAGEWTTEMELESRFFTEERDAGIFVDVDILPPFAQQIPSDYESVSDQTNSIALKTEYYTDWNGGDTSLIFMPFGRFDDTDEARTHADIREFSVLHLSGDWELRGGISKVFWGVTESQHLVDIVNQTDMVEDVDGSQKLGQPMLRATYLMDYGVMDFFILPYHRPLNFVGVEGRPGFGIPTNEIEATYQAEEGNKHIDVAFRLTQQLDDGDYSISYFNGTSRSPRFVVDDGQFVDVATSTNFHYDLIEQIGFEGLYLYTDWIFKIEAIYRWSDIEEYFATVFGFEYGWGAFMGTDADSNWFMEYNWDERGVDAATQYQDDLFTGVRFGLNDEASTELRGGMLNDLTFGTQTFRLEASRRVTSQWFARLLYQGFNYVPVEDTLVAPVQNDDYLEATLTYYFN